MNKLNFSDPTVFGRLEEEAIDGALDYSDYPPEEYKYFSKLSRLGYLNRHKGWSAEVCKEKQKEYRKVYAKDKELYERYLGEMKRINKARIDAQEVVTAMYKASTDEELIQASLAAVELLKLEPGLTDRINKYRRELKG